jgi:hypothetical protein
MQFFGFDRFPSLRSVRFFTNKAEHAVRGYDLQRLQHNFFIKVRHIGPDCRDAFFIRYMRLRNSHPNG